MEALDTNVVGFRVLVLSFLLLFNNNNNHLHKRPAMNSSLFMFLLLATFLPTANAGPAAVGLCYTACNSAYVSCLASWGIVASLVGGSTGCSAAQGACMSACTPLGAAPTP
eukprot:m.86054 g.86054  ORF g.86054 m.86054 type:complete len:111 (+) comp21302_c1_seq1:73-405(+)